MRYTRIISAGVIVALLTHAQVNAQITDVFWIGGPGPETWNSNSNWELESGGGNFIPSAEGSFNDHATIANGEIAFLSAPASFDVGEVQLGGLTSDDPGTAYDSGTLEIRNGGSLNVIDNGTTSGNFSVGRVPSGGAVLGTTMADAQRGTLSITGSGSLSVDNRFFLAQRNNSDSLLTLAGTASVNVGGDSDLRGRMQIVGPGVSFMTNTMQWGGQLRYIPEITAGTHSTLNVAGAATLNSGATIAPEFSSSPSGGEVYTLVDAASIINNGVLVDDANAGLAAGLKARAFVDESGATDQLKLAVDKVLTLTVNRFTGALEVDNVHSTGIEIKGYAIQSPSGSLNPNNGVWTSFDDLGVDGNTWEEANPNNTALSELNLTSSHVFGASSTTGFGAAYLPRQIGTPDDVTFTYQTAAGETIEGIVEYDGGRNNLVLYVDPATGDAVVRNESKFTVEINGYAIQSGEGSPGAPGTGSLLTTWDSLDDQNDGTWEEANPTTEALSELNLTGGKVLGTNDSFTLDGIWNTSGNRDLIFNYAIRGASSDGDYNDDGVVNLADYNVWRDNLGGDAAALNGNGTGGATVSAADYDLWKDNFGNVVVEGSINGIVIYEAAPALAALSISTSAVPEPSTVMMVVVAGMILVGGQRRWFRAV